MLLGLIFDVLFNFPLGFFTVVLSAILIAALLIDEFFKAESIFNRAMRGIAESFLAVFIVFLFLLGSNWPEVLAPIKISALILIGAKSCCEEDWKSTRLNASHTSISYTDF